MCSLGEIDHYTSRRRKEPNEAPFFVWLSVKKKQEGPPEGGRKAIFVGWKCGKI
jgi:hypothetical protein